MLYFFLDVLKQVTYGGAEFLYKKTASFWDILSLLQIVPLTWSWTA